MRAVVHATYPHTPDTYTEGLFWHEGSLFESTGLDGKSEVRRVALESGHVLARWNLPCGLFGEGIAQRGDEIFELTWDSNRVVVWDARDTEKRREIHLDGYGWGLSYVPAEDLFLATDGSASLTWRRPEDFKPIRTVSVVREGRTVCDLNELEPVGAVAWVNVYGAREHEILRVDLQTGHVTGVVDIAELAGKNKAGRDREVNGIAWIPERSRFLITGKNWEHIYEVTFEAAADAR